MKKVLTGKVEEDISYANEPIGIFTPDEESDYLSYGLIQFIGERVKITIEVLNERLPMSEGNPKGIGEKEMETTKTSGAGALAGMLVGGVLGLSFDLVGIIIGGIIGGILGNQIEYEREREKRMRRA